jgi:hypothetical protein
MNGWMGGWVGLRVGFININDMYNNDGGQGGARVCEGHKVKYSVALVRVPFYFKNVWLITDRHRFGTYLYYFSAFPTLHLIDTNDLLRTLDSWSPSLRRRLSPLVICPRCRIKIDADVIKTNKTCYQTSWRVLVVYY